jgi:hypothetical protein
MTWLEGGYTLLYLLSAVFWLASAFRRLGPIRSSEPRIRTAVSELTKQLDEMAHFNAYACLATFGAIMLQVISFWVEPY